MANWLKVLGIALIIVGILTSLAGMTVVLVYPEQSEGLPYDPIVDAPWWVSPLGVVMIAIGAYLYHLGKKKEEKAV